MMASQKGKEDLATQLHDWALNEMHFRPQGRHVNTKLPSPDDFRDVCMGPMVGVWQFMLQRVRSAQTVKTVKGNLALKNKQVSSGYKVKYKCEEKYSQEKADLLDRKKSLKAELTATTTAIGHVERDLERHKQDILATEKAIKECTESVSDNRRKVALLTAYSWQVAEELDKYREFRKSISQKTERHLVRAKKGLEEDQYIHRKGDEQGHKATGLETACTRQVRQACEEVGIFLHNILKGEFSSDKTLMQKRKERLWQSVEGVLGEYPANHVLQALMVHAQDTAIGLRDRTANIDIRRDAENLRFKYENGQLTDTSTEPSTLHSVHQLLMESRSSHLQRFLDTEKCLNQSARLQERLQQATQMVHDTLHRSHRDNPGAHDLAKKLFETELQTAGSRSGLQCLEEVIEELRDTISTAAQEKEAVYAKYQNIQDFRKLTESKQDLIRVLAKHNSTAKDKIDKLRTLIQQYISGSLCGHQVEVQSLSQQLKDGVSTEVDAFTKLSLPYLMFTVMESGQKLAVIDLSIHRLSNHSGSQGQTIQHVTSALEFPPYMAPELLLPKIVSVKNEVDEIEDKLRSDEMISRSLEGHEAEHKSLVEHIEDLCGQVQARDREQLDNLLPVLQKRIGQTTQALTDCLHLRDTEKAWWEQSGQWLTPWLVVDDLTYQQWRDKWTVAVTQLRQQHMA